MSYYTEKIKERIIKLLEEGEVPYLLQKRQLTYGDIAVSLNVSVQFVKNVINNYDQFYVNMK